MPTMACKVIAEGGKRGSVLGEGMFGARVIGDLAFGVVVVCCSENRIPLSGFRQSRIGWANCSFWLQKLQHLRARAVYLACGAVSIRERLHGAGTV